MGSNSYPDPTDSQLPSNTHPFYGNSRNVENDIQIAAEFSRNAVPFNTDGDQQQSVHAHHEPQHGLQYNEQEAADQEIARQLQEHAHAQYIAQQSPHEDSIDGPGSSKKRAKATRACDECRRKKIKCDAVNESGEIPCSNCKRTTAHCLFTRNPQKRGPNKGYIKDLSDRVATLEQQRSTGQGSASSLPYFAGSGNQVAMDHSLAELQDYNPVTPMASLKRSFSQSQGPQDTSSNERSEHPHNIRHDEDAALGDINAEAALGEYYQRIHPTFPILPTRNRLFSMTALCSPRLREAFFYSIEAANSADRTVAQHAAQLLADPDIIPTGHMSTGLIYLTGLVFLAMASEAFGPGGILGTLETQARWLQAATGHATFLKLYVAKNFSHPATADANSEYGIGRRLFWVVYILDRLHALGCEGPVTVHNVVLHPEDEKVLGSAIFQLAANNSGGACTIMTDIVMVAQHYLEIAPERTKDAPSPCFNIDNWTTIKLLMSKVNPMAASASNELALIARWYMHLFVTCMDVQVPPTAKFEVAEHVLSLLQAPEVSATPIHYQLKFLVASVLFELSKIDEISDRAHPELWDQYTRGMVANRLNQIEGQADNDDNTIKQGLQHLADAAIKEGQGEQGSSDVAEAIRKAEAAATAMEGPKE
ncbi:MAG: hypothetical protein Q9157_008352 [Trypethelium eluteriae]